MHHKQLVHNLDESAAILNTSVSHLWNLLRSDPPEIVSFKNGKRRYISRAELERFVQAKEQQAAQAAKGEETTESVPAI